MPSTPRWQVRRAVAGLLGDLTEFRATEDAPDLSTSVFKDARRLARDETLLANMDLVVVSATAPANLFYRTRISSANKTNRTATVDPEFPDYIRGNDQIDGFMHRGIGWRIEEYDRVGNEVIQELDKAFAYEVSAIVSQGFDRTSPYLTIPDDWVGVWGIEYQWADQTWDFTNEPFDIDQGSRQVEVPYNDRVALSTRVVRLRGYMMPELMTEDYHTTKAPPAYLKFMTAANLLLSGEGRQLGDEVENKAMLYMQRGDQLMGQASSRIRPNTVWLD